MLNPDMMTTDAFVKIAFNSVKLSLNVRQLESIGVAVHMNVSTLLEQYTPRDGDQSAFPFEAASMLARVIGPLGTQVRSVYDALETAVATVSFPKVKALMGLANTILYTVNTIGPHSLERAEITPKVFTN